MVVVSLDMLDKVYNKISNKNQLRYEDIIHYYEESSFEYEKVWMKASDFKSYLIKELDNS